MRVWKKSFVKLWLDWNKISVNESVKSDIWIVTNRKIEKIAAFDWYFVFVWNHRFEIDIVLFTGCVTAPVLKPKIFKQPDQMRLFFRPRMQVDVAESVPPSVQKRNLQ